MFDIVLHLMISRTEMFFTLNYEKYSKTILNYSKFNPKPGYFDPSHSRRGEDSAPFIDLGNRSMKYQVCGTSG